MSTSQEVLELPPDPVEIVAEFETTHEELLRAGKAALDGPCDESLEALYEIEVGLKQAVRPLFESNFFQESENPMTIDMGVGSVILSGDLLYEKTREIVGDAVTLDRFKDDSREHLSNSIATGDVSHFIVNAEGETGIAEEISDDDAKEITTSIVTTFGDYYTRLIDQYVSSVMETEGVQQYLELKSQEMEIVAAEVAQKAERIYRAKIFGTALGIAIAGTLVTNRLQKRD